MNTRIPQEPSDQRQPQACIPPALPLSNLLPASFLAHPRERPHPYPPSGLGPGFPGSCCSPLGAGLRLLLAPRWLRASSPVNSTVSMVLMKSSSSRMTK